MNVELVRRYLEGTLSEAETKKLTAWIAEGNRNRFDEMVETEMDLYIERGEFPKLEFEISPALSQRLYKRIYAKTFGADIRKKRLKKFYWSTAALVSFMVAVTLYLTYEITKADRPFFASRFIHHSGKKIITLPDGSTVILNEKSELQFGEDFILNREITLRGEAFFEVSRDPEKPFVVHAGNITTKVLGTAFNISADPTGTAVTVINGKVEVSNQLGIKEVLQENDHMVAETNSTEIQFSKSPTRIKVEWLKDYVLLPNKTMKDVVEILKEQYEIEIILESSAIENCTINMSFLRKESLDVVLTTVCSVIHCTFLTDEKGRIHISGRGCN